jgi:hypothetical protein
LPRRRGSQSASRGTFHYDRQPSVHRSGRFTVALSGGSTPKELYSLLAQAGYRERIAWSRIHFYGVMNAVSRRIIRKAIIEWFTNRSCQKSTSRLKMTIE